MRAIAVHVQRIRLKNLDERTKHFLELVYTVP